MIHGLNRHYYSIAINYRKNELEEKMLLNLHKKKWTDGLSVSRFDEQEQRNEKIVKVLQTTRLHETHTSAFGKRALLLGPSRPQAEANTTNTR